MPKPSILVISDYRGTNSVRPEAQIFIGLAKRGYDITVMTFENADYVSIFKENGIRVIPFHPTKKFSFKEIKAIRTELKSRRYDVLLLYNSKAIINGLQAARGLPVKTVLYRGFLGNIHWYDPVQYIKFLSKRADYIICNAQGVEDMFKKNLIFQQAKTVVILKKHSTTWFNDVTPANLSKLAIPSNAFPIISVANNRLNKGTHILLESLARLPKEIHLLLVGNKMNNELNMKIIAEHDLNDRVHFMGFQKDPLPLVKACKASVLPSLGGESLTKTIIEAACLGVTPLLTDLHGNKDLFVHGDSCLKFPAGDAKAMANAILKIYNDQSLRVRLGENAKQFIDVHLNIEDTINEYEDLYSKLA